MKRKRQLGDGGPSYCVRREQLGKDRKFANAERYEICLTNTQLARLGRLDKKLGCGAFACAYDEGNHAVKITSDRADVAAIEHAQDVDRVVKLYKAYELANGGRTTTKGKHIPVWALEVEKLRPLPVEAQKRFDSYLASAGRQVREAFANGQTYINNEYRRYAQDVCPVDDHRRGPACREFVDEIIDTVNALARRGVRWTDLHVDNIGLDAQGQWKAIDLGVSQHDMKPSATLLAGVRPKKKIRRIR